MLWIGLLLLQFYVEAYCYCVSLLTLICFIQDLLQMILLGLKDLYCHVGLSIDPPVSAKQTEPRATPCYVLRWCSAFYPRYSGKVGGWSASKPNVQPFLNHSSL